MSVNDEIKEICKTIREALFGEQYTECVELCTALLEFLNKSDEQAQKSYLWYAYYNRGNSYYKLAQYEKALLDAEESFYHIGKIDKLNDKYTFSLWLIASIESKTGNKKNAIEKYKRLSKLYKEMGYTNLRLASVYNIAEALNKADKMTKLKVIADTYRKLKSNNTNLTKKELVIQMKKQKS